MWTMEGNLAVLVSVIRGVKGGGRQGTSVRSYGETAGKLGFRGKKTKAVKV